MTTSNDPDQIRAEIERTRANLSDNVNALTDTVTPSHIAKRQADKARGAVVGVKDKVMGSASNLGTHVADTASGASDSITGAPTAVTSRASGNPLAAGLIAVGVGWLIGSLLPASTVEQHAAGQLKEKATPLLTDAAKEVAEHLKEPAQEAAQSVKETATDAVAAVKDEGSSAVDDVKGQASDAKDEVQDTRN